MIWHHDDDNTVDHTIDFTLEYTVEHNVEFTIKYTVEHTIEYTFEFAVEYTDEHTVVFTIVVPSGWLVHQTRLHHSPQSYTHLLQQETGTYKTQQRHKQGHLIQAHMPHLGNCKAFFLT